MKLPALALVVVLVTTAGCAHAGTASLDSRRTAQALALLRDWDHRRARAWTTGDVALLDDLYAPGSRAGRHDRAMLEAYTDRGLRVDGLRTQVLAATLRSWTQDGLVLEVTDRIVGAYAVGQGQRIGLPGDSPSTRIVTLRRESGAWLVKDVADADSPP